MDPVVRMTKQGIRDLNFYGPRKKRLETVEGEEDKEAKPKVESEQGPEQPQKERRG